MENVLAFKPGGPVITRQGYIESVLDLGRTDGLVMNLPAILDAARASAWREVKRIAETCCMLGWDRTEQEHFPRIDTVDAAVRPDLIDAAALVVACDRMLADLMPKPTVSP